MAEQDYKTRINEAKAALAEYSDRTEQLMKLYDRAIKNADDAYKAESERIAAQAKKDKNAAATDTLRLEKNLDQKLASRGLAFSGENAQTALDLSLLLQNRLADIDADALDRQADLALQTADTKASLEEKKLAAGAGQAEKKTELVSKLAGLEKEAPGETGIGAIGEGGSVSPLKVADGIASEIYDAAQTVKQKRYLTPAVSAANLAKQMVNTISGKDHIYGDKQQMGIASLLEQMQAEGELEPSYLKQLLLNLQSLGYEYESGSETASKESHLKNNATDVYFRNYNRYYKVYSLADQPADEAAKNAKKDATLAELKYLYDHTFNNDQFHKIVSEMDLTDSLGLFYESQLNKKND